MFLPIIATTIFAALALQILGYNVLGTLESHLMKIDGSHTQSTYASSTTSELDALHIQMAQKQLTIESLHGQVSLLNQELSQSKLDVVSEMSKISSLQAKINQLQSNNASWSKQAAIYSNMSSQQAVAILMQLPTREQVFVVKAMSASDQASILAAMPPKQAAILLQDGA
ncbi:MAG: hypothetical protein OWR52_01055 [Acidibacillus sp.]|nr:hypothetical protein [Acidibacillus sp.]